MDKSKYAGRRANEEGQALFDLAANIGQLRPQDDFIHRFTWRKPVRKEMRAPLRRIVKGKTFCMW